MSLRFASTGGTTHRINDGAAPAHCQFLRLWGAQAGMGSGGGTGMTSPGTINLEGSGFICTPLLTEKDNWLVQGCFKNSTDLAGGAPMMAGIVWYRQGVEQLRLIAVPQPTSASHGFHDGYQYHWELRRGATVLASTRKYYSRDWVVIQTKIFFNDSGGAPNTGTAEVRIMPTEGAVGDIRLAQETVINIAGVDTTDAGINGVDEVRFDYQVETGLAFWDHFLVWDTDGAAPWNDFPSEPWLFVHGTIPNANGDLQEWASQGGQGAGGTFFEAFNDSSSVCTDDIGRGTSETPGERILFDFQIPGEAGIPASETGPTIGSGNTVRAVVFHHVSGMEASGSLTVRSLYRNIADTDNEGPDLVLSGTDFVGYTEFFELNPISAAPWTVQETKEMQWGLKLQA